MLVEMFNGYTFWQIFLIVSVLALIWYHIICGTFYYFGYVKKTLTPYKTQATYPSNAKVLDEALKGSWALMAATLNISLMIYFGQHGWNRLIIHWQDASLMYHVISITAVILIVEVFEWWFHWLSHNNDFVWLLHRKHHKYPNPTPYCVLSDHFVDMWVKSSPLLWIPFIIPISDVALVGWFLFVNMLYGTYLHSGFEIPGLPSRYSKWFVSSWHHNIHHAINVPKNFGFFTGIMDIIFGTRYTPEDYERGEHVRKSSKLSESVES